jgi:SpoVK/Ycf46/Vps4 family AAA+-type ATPase
MFYHDDQGIYAYFQQHPESRTLPQVPAGLYRFIAPQMFSPPKLAPIQLRQEPIIDVDTHAYRLTADMVRQFFTPETRDKHRRLRVPHRMGILLHGKQGTGKTTLLRKVVQAAIDMGALCIEADPDQDTLTCIQIARDSDPCRPVLILWEEFDQAARECEEEVKRMMDGIDSPEGVLFLATTNYLSRIPATLCQRPGRFAHVLEVGLFDKEERRLFLEKILADSGLTEEERAGVDVAALLEVTEGKTTDEIKHTVMYSLIYGIEPERTLDAMQELSNVRVKPKRLKESAEVEAAA